MGGHSHEEVNTAPEGLSQRNDVNSHEENTSPQSFAERWKNEEYKRKYMKTLWLAAAYGALGFSIGQRGPAFLDLQIITQTDMEAASFFFTASSVGYLLGSLVGGVLYDKVNKSLVLVLCVLGMALTTAALPWCAMYGLMIAIHFVVANFAGGLDTVVNAELVRVWGKEGEMAMQFLHFSFAVGGVIAPLVTEPFLTPLPPDDSTLSLYSSGDVLNHSNPRPSPHEAPSSYLTSTAALSDVTLDVGNVSANASSPSLPLTTNVHYAYMICGILLFLTAVPLTVELFRERYQKKRQDRGDEKEGDVKQPLPRGLFLFVSAVLLSFYFVYCCVDDTFASFLATFVVKQLDWSKTSAAQVSSVFWASFAAGRFLSIFIVRFLNSAQLIIACCLCLILSMLGFLLFAYYTGGVGVWVCTLLGGMSMGPVFATGFTWMEKELVRLTGRMISALLVASSAGNMANPVLTGYLMQESTPMWFCYLLLAESVLCLLLFLFLLAVARLYVSKRYVIHSDQVQETVIPSFTDTEKTTVELFVCLFLG